jgi:hypothetical protein
MRPPRSIASTPLRMFPTMWRKNTSAWIGRFAALLAINMSLPD